MIQTQKSRAGELTAKIDSIYLHSTYSPKTEAARFFENRKLSDCRTIILIEPGFNYIADVIKKKNKGTKIISIHLETFLYNSAGNKSDFSFLYSNDTFSLITFLSKAITEIDIESLKIISWPPAEKIFNSRINLIKQTLLQYIRELHGNITTTSGFGKKHLLNFFKNYIHTDNFFIPVKSDKPVLIAGSGPSLKVNIDFIIENRKKFILIALPSSLHFLRYNNISPDLTISTDPGYFASKHLLGFEDIYSAAPFTASVPVKKSDSRVLFFKQDYFLEYFFNSISSLPQIPSNGTVAGSALFFSRLLTDGPIIITGLDFSYYDLLSHNRPHTFDSIIEGSTNRCTTLQTAYFLRNIAGSKRLNGILRTNHALETYSGWFKSNSSIFNKNCFFLESEIPPVFGFTSLNYQKAASFLDSDVQLNFKINNNGSFSDRKNHVFEAIEKLKLTLDEQKNTILNLNSGEEIVKVLNNKIIFNLFLPELLEVKRHFIDKSGKEVQNKAVSLIMKTKSFISDFINYV